MNPAFSTQYMKSMLQHFLRATKILVHKWKNLNGKPANIHLAFTQLTLDVIGTAGFGYDFNCQLDSTGVIPKAVEIVLHETEKRIFQMIPLWKFSFYPGTVRFEKAKKILLYEIEQIIHKRKSSGNLGEDASDLLGRLLINNDISIQDLRDELITFLIAGHETTAAALAFSIYLVYTHPEVLKKKYEKKLIYIYLMVKKLNGKTYQN